MPVLRKNYLKITAILIIQCVVTVAGGLVFAVPGENTIYPGVFIGGVEVGNMSQDQAVWVLEKKVNEALGNENLVLKYKDRRWALPYSGVEVIFDLRSTVKKARSIGRADSRLDSTVGVFKVNTGKPDIPVDYSINETLLQQTISSIGAEINTPPQDARLDIQGGRVSVIPETIGRNVDILENAKAVKDALGNLTIKEINLRVTETKPAVTAESFKGITDSLGLGITVFSNADQEMTTKILATVEALNGTMVMPGQTFSFNSAINSMVPEGFGNSLMIDGVVRGGTESAASQVATTLYQAALYSGLRIKERHAHAEPPRFVGFGQDAAVVSGVLDLKFENTGKTPVYINASIKDKRIIVNIYGSKKSGQTINIITNKDSSGRGVSTEVYRIFYNSGAIVGRELISKDHYR